MCSTDNIKNVPRANGNHKLQPSPLSNQQKVSTKYLALLDKEVPNMKELMNNAIELNQLLQNTGMIDNKGDESLILVMISSMNHIIDNPKSTVELEASQTMNIHSEFDTTANGINTHGERDHTYKYVSNLNDSKWAMKALTTKTDLNPQRTPDVSSDNYKRKYILLSPSASIHGESLSTSIDGELGKFRVANRDNDHSNENGEHWKPNKIIDHRKMDRPHNSYNVVIAWENG